MGLHWGWMRISNVLGAIGNARFAVGNECCVEEAVSTLKIWQVNQREVIHYHRGALLLSHLYATTISRRKLPARSMSDNVEVPLESRLRLCGTGRVWYAFKRTIPFEKEECEGCIEHEKESIKIEWCLESIESLVEWSDNLAKQSKYGKPKRRQNRRYPVVSNNTVDIRRQWYWQWRNWITGQKSHASSSADRNRQVSR